jgi:hypothetical protein
MRYEMPSKSITVAWKSAMEKLSGLHHTQVPIKLSEKLGLSYPTTIKNIPLQERQTALVHLIIPLSGFQLHKREG